MKKKLNKRNFFSSLRVLIHLKLRMNSIDLAPSYISLGRKKEKSYFEKSLYQSDVFKLVEI